MDREMLDPRLLCVAKHIRRGSVLADIGTDHAHLPVYLVERGVCPRAIASDRRRRRGKAYAPPG